MVSFKFLASKPWTAVFEGEGGDDAAAKAAADKALADKALADKAAADKKFSQEDVNTFMKKEKDKFVQEKTKLLTQLEELQNTAKMTAEQRTQLETRIEELRQSTMTAEEKARRQAEKLQKDYDDKLKIAEASAQSWQNRHNTLQVGYEIQQAASKHEVLPQALIFVESYLKPQTRLVEKVDDDTGKPNGMFAAKVKFPTKDKEGQPVVLDFTVDEALKAMKDDPDSFGHLFKGAAGGTGTNNGTPGKKAGVAKMSTAEYMEARKKDPKIAEKVGK